MFYMTVWGVAGQSAHLLTVWGKGIYHGHKITRQAGQGASANLSKFHVCGEDQRHCDHRNAGDHGGNADLALNLPDRHRSRSIKRWGNTPPFLMVVNDGL